MHTIILPFIVIHLIFLAENISPEPSTSSPTYSSSLSATTPGCFVHPPPRTSSPPPPPKSSQQRRYIRTTPFMPPQSEAAIGGLIQIIDLWEHRLIQPEVYVKKKEDWATAFGMDLKWWDRYLKWGRAKIITAKKEQRAQREKEALDRLVQQRKGNMYRET